jgi:hypothetical protein
MTTNQIHKRLKLAAKVLNTSYSLHSEIEFELNEMFPTLKEGRKTAKDLAQEIMDGESTLIWKYEKVHRLVRVAFVEVLYEGAILVEAYQENALGERWKRGIKGISEKIKSLELPLDAAIRGIKEELGLDIYPHRMNYSGTDDAPSLITRSAYQGINSLVEKHNFWVSLKREEYKPEYLEIQKDKTTVFQWEY